MKSNITLIGMPGAGKSTIGIILAKIMTWGFMDTDVLIQINHQKSLQRIMDESDYLNLRAIESREILKINVENHVIATGGSAVYSPEAMRHLLDISTVVFLKVDYETLKKRIHNFNERGITKADGQSFKALFDERRPLYEKYARITIEGDDLSQDETAMMIVSAFNN
ncbi:MAG: shikimate kinase [Deltaproteobacteria bacterium]|nr:shikimate kinase [Deltaproteobacteria bacterium]